MKWPAVRDLPLKGGTLGQIVLKKCLQLARPYWGLLLLALLLSAVASALSGSVAWLVKPVLDDIFIGKNYTYLRLLPLAIIALYFLRGFTTFLQAYLMRMASLRLSNDLREKMYAKLLKLPVGEAGRETAGRIVSRVINDTATVEPILADVFKTLTLEGFTIITLVAVAISRRWDLALLSFTVFPAVAFGARKMSRKARKTRHRAQEEIANLTHRVNESIQGLREIKVYRQEKSLLQKFRRELYAYYRFLLKVTKYREGSKLIVDILTGVGGALVLTYGGFLIVRGSITPGDFFSILTAILMTFTPVRKISRAYTSIHDASAALERIEDILSYPEEKGGRRKAKAPHKGLSLARVSFKYPHTADWVLKDIELEIPAGKVTAIVGPSGAGKTTLISLIPRFYDPTLGKVLLDGIDLKEFDLSSLRELIGLVSQDIVLFNATVYENIAFGKPGASREEVIAAAKMAYAHEFIVKLPQGYDTVLGHKGFNLSGGQKQRLAIARAILKNPPILILDEATSHLDAVSEQKVQQALEKLMRTRTTIVIAHRLSTIRDADLLVVMDHGKIVDQGRHEEIINRCPLYRELYYSFSRPRKVIPLKKKK